jgi:ABC-2 type transport system permease protein
MSLKEELRAILAIIYSDIKIYYRYPMNLLSTVVTPLGLIFLFFLFHTLLSPEEFSGITGYSSGVGPFALIGMSIYWLDRFGWEAGATIQREATWGTIEPNFMMPIRRSTYVSGLIVSRLFTQSIVSLIMIIVAIAWVSFEIQISAIALCALILILGAFSSFGVGLIMCGISLRYKQVVQLSIMITLFTQFLTGAFIPLQVIPYPIRYVSYAFPVTWTMDSFRSQLMGFDPIMSLKYEITILVALSVALIIVGILVFRFFERKTRISGMMGMY